MQQENDWQPGVAAVLSLVIPGAGQIYKGRIGAGLVWLICTVLGYVALILPGIIIHIICIVNAASGKKSSVVDDSPSARTHIVCPECAEFVRKEAKKCKHCGAAITAQA